MLLALDTATAYVSVCVADGAEVLAARDDVGPMQHGEQLAPTVAWVLADAGVGREDLTGIVLGVGPGPYTGLRVGVVTARVLGLSLGVPVRGVCSLDALAWSARPGEPFLATLDARRKELFWAAYDADARRVAGPFVDRPDQLPEGLVVGAGPSLWPHAFSRTAGPQRPRAADLAAASRVLDPLAPEPIYLRRPDVMAPSPRRRVS